MIKEKTVLLGFVGSIVAVIVGFVFGVYLKVSVMMGVSCVFLLVTIVLFSDDWEKGNTRIMAFTKSILSLVFMFVLNWMMWSIWYIDTQQSFIGDFVGGFFKNYVLR